ncbi:MAG: 2-phospho-L-lactate guanylyltransferase [Clostridia bacterium]|nr:2-phospho-L-lactate guanylyltransferase [Clostridia bacterium]
MSCALIPMKPLAQAKTRLAAVLTPAQRRRLCLWMLSRVVEACVRADFDHIEVLGGDEVVAAAAERWGAHVRPEPAAGLNASLAVAMRDLQSRRRAAVVVVPGDVPLVTPNDLSVLRELAVQGFVALAPSADGTGTNGLGVPETVNLAPRLGPDSLARHLEDCCRAAVPHRVVHLSSLALDVDTPSDLAALLRKVKESGRSGGSRHEEKEGPTPCGSVS